MKKALLSLLMACSFLSVPFAAKADWKTTLGEFVYDSGKIAVGATVALLIVVALKHKFCKQP